MRFKKIFLFVFSFFIFTPFFYVHGEELGIETFDARIVVNKNAEIEVTERISYNFGNERKHGIYREIPYSYQAGTETYTADVTSVIVTDGIGNPIPFGESRGNGTLTVKIGDPKKTVTGEQVYVISYLVSGPFLYFDDHDEFYWNVTGFWLKPIKSESALVDLPVGAKILSVSCYKGVEGSNQKCDSDERLLNAERAGYTASAKNLKKNEGFTIAVAFPKGVIAEIKKPWEKNKSGFLQKFLPYGVPAVTLLYVLYLWFTKGRDPKKSSTIVTQFEPPENISPAIADIIYSQRLGKKGVSAEIIKMAVDGYIKIHRFEKKHLIFSTTEYLFEKISDETPKDKVTSVIFKKIFQDKFESNEEINGKEVKGVLVSKMKNDFQDEIRKINDTAFGFVKSKKYYISRPDKASGWISYLGWIFLVVGVVLCDSENKLPCVSFILTSVFIYIISNLMPAKTKKGMKIKEYLEGLKRYLNVAEKDRIEFHNAPEKSPKLFDKLLPYAMVLGVEKEWAKQFEDIYTSEPEWFEGGTTRNFATGSFVSDVSSFSSDFASATMPSSSGSYGGGSSGGGFGGGGGGSW
jgi:hypothetical protein